MNPKLVVRWGLGFLLTVIILGYSYFRFVGLLAGPSIIIHTPLTGAVVHDPLVTISGQAERIAKITLDGRQIFTDNTAQGNFKEPLLLAPGYNILEVKAEDTFGRQTAKKIELVFNK